ncbi:MAG TPA: response regulator [Bacteroidales bacterium]|nr:response regulator [Bacteroidales bacterium]
MDSKGCILIIDDSGTSLQLLEFLLGNEGFQTLLAESVPRAIEQIKNRKPDLILLDLQMPEISGYDFLKMTKELKIQDVPIIVVSAYDTPENIKLTKSLGASEFLPKPIKTSILLERIKTYF